MPDPQPGEGEVVVRVVTAGTNPGEVGIRSGALAELLADDVPGGARAATSPASSPRSAPASRASRSASR